MDFFFDCQGPPPNDVCETATPVSCNTLLAGETNQYAIDDYDSGSLCTDYSSAGPDVVYSFIAPGSGTVTVDMDNLGFDASLYVVTDCGDIAGSCVAGADDALSGGGEQLSFESETGVTYYIIADKYGSGGGGAFDLNVACAIPQGACCNTNTGLCSEDAYRIDCSGPKDIWSPGEMCADITCMRVVPTVTEWGLVLMTLLGCVLGTIVFARHRAVARN
jgi:hypothetical protein